MNGDANGAKIMDLVLKSIGIINSEQIEPYQAGRQPDKLSRPATLELQGPNFLQAVQDLEGCSHLWLIFGFHHNQNWKPLVQTPRSDRKIGVFATRAPYRPNALGLSCVSLTDIQHTTLYLGPNDLLHGTPVYDIKPYVAEVDCINDSRVTWLKTSTYPKMEINFSPSAEGEINFLEINNLRSLRPFILRQLEYDPTNSQKKRIEKNNHFWTLAYRTWRIDYLITDNSVGILAIRSGYSSDDLMIDTDIYEDKTLHKKFIKQFS